MAMLIVSLGVTPQWITDCTERRGVSIGDHPLAASLDGSKQWKKLHEAPMGKAVSFSLTGHWPDRERWMVSRIPNGAVVLDLGAGQMHLNHTLQRQRSQIQYIPVDAYARSSANIIICNLNVWEYPLSIVPPPTVIVAQGIMEWINDKFTFWRMMRCAYPHAKLLLSSTMGHGRPSQELSFWAAPLTKRMFGNGLHLLGFEVQNKSVCMRAPVESCYDIIFRWPPPPGICPQPSP